MIRRERALCAGFCLRAFSDLMLLSGARPLDIV